jgi:hypothetical protein
MEPEACEQSDFKAQKPVLERGIVWVLANANIGFCGKSLGKLPILMRG